MNTISIMCSVPPTAYQVDIGTHMLKNLTEYLRVQNISSIFLLSDSHVGKLYLPRVIDGLKNKYKAQNIHAFSVPAGEQSKSIQTLELVYQQLVEMRADRKTLCINVGGGVVSDLGGFAASTFMRGLRFVHIPTTIEAMVDASVGGKTGVNFAGHKNYIGSFAKPSQVIIDVSVLQTLPIRPLRQGFAEVIKHALIADRTLFSSLMTCSLSDLDDAKRIEMIRSSVQIKAAIVQKDPFELGERKLLNFGHTVGHVLEEISHHTSDPLYHGEAVAIGMVAESRIALEEGLITHEEFEQIVRCLRHFDLPTSYHHNGSLQEVESLLVYDKKNTDGILTWTLLRGIGRGIVDYEASRKSILAGLQFIFAHD